MYTKNTWTTGDVITAEKLNNMEDGIAPFIVEGQSLEEGYGQRLNKTFGEIYNAFKSGRPVLIVTEENSSNSFYEEINIVYMVGYSDGGDTHSGNVKTQQFMFSAQGATKEELFLQYPEYY